MRQRTYKHAFLTQKHFLPKLAHKSTKKKSHIQGRTLKSLKIVHFLHNSSFFSTFAPKSIINYVKKSNKTNNEFFLKHKDYAH